MMKKSICRIDHIQKMRERERERGNRHFTKKRPSDFPTTASNTVIESTTCATSIS